MQLSTTLMGVCTQQLLPTRDGRGRVRRLRDAGRDAGRAQPDPRGQDAPDLLRPCRPAPQFGMQTMDAALADLVRRGIITRELAKNRSSTPRSSSGCWASPPPSPAAEGCRIRGRGR